MKASNVTQPIEPLNFSQPRISYTSATHARFQWHGQTHIVGSCDLATLTAFLMHHARRARLPAHQLKELLDLLDYQELGRWQSIDTALTFGVVLPLERVT
jgi:hypothetical protein